MCDTAHIKSRRIRRKQLRVFAPITENELYLHFFISNAGGW
jgi:hypothetical protein